ncbi:yippee zinc-binding/DNA-binding /Mis18, centromere assembly-domain-containing protein [Apodospora peruviana]|uniref:Yippee zinc-binding/DNA-binding /Mis18, centromere assembly-domain-containing protein n=1 Tax=Apodospora peruviana TaxID=516989 RepID=A0AAE0IK74_9PEZI|nr:yippee zinc-binding/DNA-binding /Mis18, centromere assembly-domain-containing protein [Apodospora peruviana]
MPITPAVQAIMFGSHSTSVVRLPAPAAPEGNGPTFPLYLLPSLSLPFRRRRRTSSISTSPTAPAPPQSPSETTDSEYYYDTSSIPSLSSSPASSTDMGGSPRSIKSFFPELPSLNQLHFLTGGTSSSKSKSPTENLGDNDGQPKLSRVHPDTLRCNLCSTDIAFCSQIVSKGFTGRHGRAYLVSPPSAHHRRFSSSHFDKWRGSSKTKNSNSQKDDVDLINVRVGRPENRQLVTGAHVVADIACAVCASKLGWKYVDAREQAQKYKVGKFILETQRVVASHAWEDVFVDVYSSSAPEQGAPLDDLHGVDQAAGDANEVIVFDSDDEDECDDIFAGVWDPEVVAKRRRGKVANMRRNGGASAAAVY